jgi:hypothetical protein
MRRDIKKSKDVLLGLAAATHSPSAAPTCAFVLVPLRD